MDNQLFTLKDDISSSALKDAVHACIAKTKAIVSYMLAVEDHTAVSQRAFHDAVWAIDGYLEELQVYCDKLG